MFSQLLKKDFLLIKKNLYAMCAILAIVPFLIMKSTDLESVETIGLIYVGTFIVIVMSQYLAVRDFQFPKAETMLCALPYSRKQLVMARYCLCIVVSFLLACFFALENYLISGIHLIRLESVLLLIFIIFTFVAIYFPIQYYYGYEKTRFIFLVSILLLTFGSSQYNIKGLSFHFSGKQLMFWMLGLSCILLIISICLSIKIYENKDF